MADQVSEQQMLFGEAMSDEIREQMTPERVLDEARICRELGHNVWATYLESLLAENERLKKSKREQIKALQTYRDQLLARITRLERVLEAALQGFNPDEYSERPTSQDSWGNYDDVFCDGYTAAQFDINEAIKDAEKGDEG